MKQCLVITTINKPTRAVLEFLKYDYDLIVVGDTKTPPDYHNLECVFLDLKAQEKLFPTFSRLSPTASYARKNFGYLYALKEGYDLIAESDDDNIPLPHWGQLPSAFPSTITAPRYPNVYSLYTEQHVWPRGFPLDHINQTEKIVLESKPAPPPFVLQGLANLDPDVDAIYRLVIPEKSQPITFIGEKTYLLKEGMVSPFNSQNTFWRHQKSFPWLYLPATTTMRYTDILRSYIAQFAFWAHGGALAFIPASVFQERNFHHLMRDFADEVPVYLHFHPVMELLSAINFSSSYQALLTVYQKLHEKALVSARELDIVREWIKLLAHFLG